jgi:hypothetical protein
MFRFCFCYANGDRMDTALQRHLEKFPNLVAAIVPNPVLESSLLHAGKHRFTVFLYKAITSATLFGIIAHTPAYTRSFRNSQLVNGPLAPLQELDSLHLLDEGAYNEHSSMSNRFSPEGPRRACQV